MRVAALRTQLLERLLPLRLELLFNLRELATQNNHFFLRVCAVGQLRLLPLDGQRLLLNHLILPGKLEAKLLRLIVQVVDALVALLLELGGVRTLLLLLLLELLEVHVGRCQHAEVLLVVGELDLLDRRFLVLGSSDQLLSELHSLDLKVSRLVNRVVLGLDCLTCGEPLLLRLLEGLLRLCRSGSLVGDVLGDAPRRRLLDLGTLGLDLPRRKARLLLLGLELVRTELGLRLALRSGRSGFSLVVGLLPNQLKAPVVLDLPLELSQLEGGQIVLGFHFDLLQLGCERAALLLRLEPRHLVDGKVLRELLAGFHVAGDRLMHLLLEVGHLVRCQHPQLGFVGNRVDRNLASVLELGRGRIQLLAQTLHALLVRARRLHGLQLLLSLLLARLASLRHDGLLELDLLLLEDSLHCDLLLALRRSQYLRKLLGRLLARLLDVLAQHVVVTKLLVEGGLENRRLLLLELLLLLQQQRRHPAMLGLRKGSTGIFLGETHQHVLLLSDCGSELLVRLLRLLLSKLQRLALIGNLLLRLDQRILAALLLLLG